MKIDIGEVFSRAWQITWKHKTLWVYGSVFGLVMSLMFPLLFIPTLFPSYLLVNSGIALKSMFLILGGFIFLLVAFILALYPLSALIQTALTFGVLDVEQGDGKLPIIEIVKKGLPYFWRVLGLMFLYAAGMLLFQAIIQGLVFLVSILTLGLGTICLIPLTLLMYPVIFISAVWMELAMNGILISQMDVISAAKHGWELIRNNLLPFGLIALVIYFGTGMVSTIFIMPLMFPMFMIPFGFIAHETNWVILFIAIFGMVIMIPLFALLTGWSAAFSKSVWVLSYLRVTHPTNELQPVASQAADNKESI